MTVRIGSGGGSGDKVRTEVPAAPTPGTPQAPTAHSTASVLDVLDDASPSIRRSPPALSALAEPDVARVVSSAPAAEQGLWQVMAERTTGAEARLLLGRLRAEVLEAPLLAKFDAPSQRAIVGAIADRGVQGLGMWVALRDVPEQQATLFVRELVRWPLGASEVFLDWVFFVRDVHIAALLGDAQLTQLMTPVRECAEADTATLLTRQLFDALLVLDELQPDTRADYVTLLSRLWMTADSAERVQALAEQCAGADEQPTALRLFAAAAPPVLDQVGEWLAQRATPVSAQELTRLLAEGQAALAPPR